MPGSRVRVPPQLFSADPAHRRGDRASFLAYGRQTVLALTFLTASTAIVTIPSNAVAAIGALVDQADTSCAPISLAPQALARRTRSAARHRRAQAPSVPP